MRLSDYPTVRFDIDNGRFETKLVQLAYYTPGASFGTLYMLSVVGPQAAVKSQMAALNQNGKLAVYIRECDLIEPHVELHRCGNQGSYEIHMHRIRMNYVHALAVSKSPTFLLTADEETVWKKLCSPPFTTPLLREWVPYLVAQMKAKGLMGDLKCYDCQCGQLWMTSDKLDELVSEGLKEGAIAIPRKAGAA